MHLSLHSDYALRVLMYLVVHEGEQVSIDRIATAFDISANHLVKVVHALGKQGFIETRRGRGGGLRLARDPAAIGLGEVVRSTESLALVECFDPATNTCPIDKGCGLKGALGAAMQAFLATLDSYTLADVTRNERTLRRRLQIVANRYG